MSKIKDHEFDKIRKGIETGKYKPVKVDELPIPESEAIALLAQAELMKEANNADRRAERRWAGQRLKYHSG